MNVLVTGGAGYVGSIVVSHLLSSGYNVRVLDSLLHGGDGLLGVWSHPNFQFVRADIRDTASVKPHLSGVEAIVHLAAIVGDPACARQPAEAKSVNLEASLLLRDLAVESGVQRFLFASTCSNYGKMETVDTVLDESSALRPVSLYAETKVAVERALLEDQNPGFAPTCLRFATAYGVSPRMRFDLTVNHFTMEIVGRKKLVVFGEQFWRPYVHIRDMAAAVRLVLDSPAAKVAHSVFNVGSNDQNFRKCEIVDLIRPFAPEAIIEHVHRQEDPRDYRVSFDRIVERLGFKTVHTVSSGINEVAALVRSGVIRDFDSPSYTN